MRMTDDHEAVLAETVTLEGADGAPIHAYYARPLGPGPFPSMLLFHHRPGWDEWYRHVTRLFAANGFQTLCPDLYCRAGHGEPDDVAARVGAEGGVSDTEVVDDAAGFLRFLRTQPASNGRVGVMGTCSGGRHAYLTACRLPDDVDAVVDCWGGRIVVAEDELTERQPVAPVDFTADLAAPVLGLFGNDDANPNPAHVDALEDALQRHGKDHEFHRYDGAGHGFFYHDRPSAYRAEAAVDGWNKVWDFLGRHLT